MPKQSIRILGLDPGSRATGYGVIDKAGNRLIFVACGVIRVQAKIAFIERLKEIHDGISEVIGEYQPTVAAIEDVFVSVNTRSALKLGQARGAIIVAALSKGLPVHEYSARGVKLAVAGYGNATKEQVQHMVKTLLSLSAKPSQDASDALAVAICAANHLR